MLTLARKPMRIRPATEPGTLAAVRAIGEPVAAADCGLDLSPELAALALEGERLVAEWQAAGCPKVWRPARR